MNKPIHIVFLAALSLRAITALHAADKPAEQDTADPAKAESQLLSDIRQLTFAGKRSGEGYFSADGTKMVFQSEREADNPFYQIYVLDLETGDTQRVSQGHGKTTCAWIHPSGKKVMFASTHEDPEAKAKQEAELEFRASGKERRYSWDYDEHFDLFAHDLESDTYRNLTKVTGYDAEGAYSPDGELIVFASNRHAYTGELDAEDAKRFGYDKSYMMDIYIMQADGSGVKRLTDTKGYDGGPFFNADGTRICWRRFNAEGTLAEIYTMNLDGSDQRKLTSLNAMSWAPYFHPSGQYLIFATNKHGFANFELYLVDARGEKEPVRVTHTPGFDGLPVFSPDGTKLSWTSNRTPKKQSQIFLAKWDHDAALKMLGLHKAADVAEKPDAPVVPQSADITVDEIKRHVTVLASRRFAGRLTGTPGEQLATDYVADEFRSYGLAPAGEGDSYFMPFTFTSGVKLGEGNTLTLHRNGETTSHKVDEQWRPLAFTQTGKVEPTEITFAGYGIVEPGDDGKEYDSYVHTDVAGKWVMVLRYVPDGLDKERRAELARYASLRHKAMIARDKGAAGIIVVSGPNAKVRDELVPLAFDTTLAGTSIAAISVTDEIAAAWMKAAGKDLKQLHDTLDKGELVMGFDLKDIKLGGNIEVIKEKRTGRNVLARLNAGDKPAGSPVIIGGHVDHLGTGPTGSRARKGEEGMIHFGADDNASGIAALLEIAQKMAEAKRAGKLKLKRDVVFAAWSGEELGLLGSSAYVEEVMKKAHGHGHGAGHGHEQGHGKSGDAKPASGHAQASGPRAFTAYLNMDMIGRYREKVMVQGTGSSGVWTSLIERANVPVGLKIVTQSDAYLPTDSTPFYASGVPILSVFTGAHEEYHTPRDTPDLLNYEGIEDIATFTYLVTRSLATADEAPEYVAMKRPTGGRSGGRRAYLGTIPDYAQGDIKGVKLSGVAKGGPADKAGLKSGDLIVELNGKKIENIYDFTYAIGDLKIDKETTITVNRDGKEVKLKITPGSRE